MKSINYSLVILFAFSITVSNSYAQKYHSYKGTSTFNAKVSFKDIEEHDNLYPAKFTKGRRIHNEIEKFPEISIAHKDIIYQAPKQQEKPYSTIKDPSPLPDADFLGLDDNGNSIPPDVNGAAGPDHLMITLNTQIRIMDKEGNPISTVGTGSFWHSVPGSGSVFDPKISYDSFENRWIFIMPSSSDPSSSRLMVAVSETSDPTGNWFVYSFDADPDDTHWFDYPNFGFNKKWIIVSGNMFGSAQNYSALFVFSKADLYNNVPVAEYSRFKIYNAPTLIPAVTYDTEEEDVYMVNNAGGNSGGYGYLNLWKVTGAINNPEVIDLGLTGVPEPWGDWAYNWGSDFAPQLGSDEKINTVDARMENMVYRNGKLWCVHHIYLPADDPVRCSVQWWELALDGEILQWGRVDDETGLNFYAFATIAVNSNEDIMIGYASFSSEQYASGSYSFRYADDPVNTLRERYQYIDGLAPYYKTYGGSRNRWGDYTATWVDPVDDLDFWTIQQYADLPVSLDLWGTWWAYINIDAVPEAGFTSNITSVPTGTGVHFTDLSRYEPSEWSWIFEGGTPSTSTAQNPQIIIYENSGLYDVTLIATNYLGSDTLVLEDYIDANTTILPEIYFIVNDTLPCIGDTVAFEDLSIYNPVAWLWEFAPDYVTFVNGTDETSQNPQVSFNYPFAYELTLTVTNNNGSSSLSKSGLIKSGGKPLPFVEDFESKFFTSQAWTIDNPDDSKTWEITTIGGNEPGDQAAYININKYSGFGERDRLISPLFNFYEYKNITLEFQFAYAQRFQQYTDSLIVYISADCGNSWTRLLEMGEDSLNNFATSDPITSNFIPQTPEEWCGIAGNPECISIDLSGWDGSSNVQIMFESYNGFGNNIFIDNVSIDGTINSINKPKESTDNFNIYPNPSNGSFSILIKNLTGHVDMRVSNLTGQIVYEENFECFGAKTKKSFDLSDKNNGIYIIEIQCGNTNYVQKFVLK
ncbi:MAG: PKD domain-containing protein [Bacteroidales bacterium]|nr:PKD domain-containing protein [Bacteroidales bacterium]